MSSRVAGIDVHKKMLAVVAAEPAVGEWEFERERFGTTLDELERLRKWLLERNVRQVVMESTAQYWRTVWLELEQDFHLELAQAHSNRARRGRKRDFRDAERLARRYVAGDLILSLVPDPEQRGWRMLTRMKVQLVRDRGRLQNQVEALLEQARIKLGTVVSDLLGLSARRMLRALANGVRDPEQLAKLGHACLRASREDLAAALRGEMNALQQRVLGMYLDRIELLDQQLETLEKEIAAAMSAHQDAVQRLAEVPGLGPDSALAIVAELGPEAATFDSPQELASWVGVCPGDNVSAEKNSSSRSAKGNVYLRRLLDQAAQAAARKKGSVFEAKLRHLKPKLGYQGAVWAVAHKLVRLIWLILRRGVRYIEYGEQGDLQAQRRRMQKMARRLQALGWTVLPPQPEVA
jgi:transposase